ncbi:Pollen receptor-like kinase 1 [Striga hermonthica]|uniref:Pollen receptor-like kinase 1 n=1 Tax=Striga hermonthica TaxID=68872 RepID=A0A9N7N0U5_STRHE|nr:Pollen receptor-like kinase 1 [Striga hermonthica]
MDQIPAILLLTALLLLLPPSSQAESEAEILLKFKESLHNTGALSSWSPAGKPPCSDDHENWVGVLCQNNRVWGLQLENMGLDGTIDMTSLAQLPDLRALSFMGNSFDGPLPNITSISALRSIYLSNNRFDEEIHPNYFQGMQLLKKVYLANNKLSGPIPVSLVALPRLRELVLDNNNFVGEIPAFPQDTIMIFSAANNELVGPIPASLSKFSVAAFDGNKDLCGGPLKSCDAPSQLTIGTKIGVALVVTAALAALIVVVVILRRRKQLPPPSIGAGGDPQAAELVSMEQGQQQQQQQQQHSFPGLSSPEKSSPGKKSEMSVKITFLREDRDKFDMSDLLKASAEILGSGVFGSTYKAALNNGEMMVVKRFRYMNNVNKEEFHEHMRRLGRLAHPNVLQIVGFYYRKEEKLLVTDYAAKGVCRGLVYLYNELPSLTAPHGHLKSSNVLLDADYSPLLTDYGLVPVVNQEYAQDHMISYKSPEYRQAGRITKKTDVWSLGILVLEIMTGRFPSNFVQQGSSDQDLAAWVSEAVAGGADEVFDADMAHGERSVPEMERLVRIGLECCDSDVEKRPDIKEAASRIEEVREE